MPFRILLIFAAALLASATAPGPSAAQPSSAASDWTRTEFADIRLVSAVAGTEGRDAVPLGLEFRLAEGWKVYWRSAGDAGYPPEVDWTGSANLTKAQTNYPVPHRFSLFGLETFGYEGSVVYPITAQLTRPGAPLNVRADVNALVCSEICVPLDATLLLDLPAATPAPTAFTQLIERWVSQVPRDLPGVGLNAEAVRAVGDPASPTLRLTVRSDQPLTALDVFPEGPDGLSFGKPEIVPLAGGLGASVAVPVGIRGDASLSGADLRLTLVDGARFVERPVTVDTILANAPRSETAFGLILLFALVGGLILNLMPCVLPVLSLKLVSAVSYGGADRRAIRAGFLASAAGILFSFLLLAAMAAGLKAAGVAVGWGIQFQQPLFLAFMTSVVLLFAANLWGWFEVPLPRALASLGERLPSERTGGSNGLVGHFSTGAFAALLATPCSAPFLGTAVGFALSRGTPEILAVFLVMGIGLALPYFAVAAAPGIARALPRPGPWMVTLKKILALALVATGVWLMTVLAVQTGQVTVLSMAGLFLVAAVVLALAHRAGRRIAGPAGIAVVAVSLVLAATAQRPGPEPVADRSATVEAQTVSWQGFALQDINRRVAAGEIVLVDVTADWCITCKVNKRLVLDRDPVATLLADGTVTPVRADWTNPDPVIADYLAAFGRYGIPFNAVYGPGAPQGIALPELLSADAVLAAVEQARPGEKTAHLDSRPKPSM